MRTYCRPRLPSATVKNLLGVLIACCLSACATSRGFDRGALRSDLAGPAVVTDQDIQKALDAKAQLPHPFKLGVYFASPPSGTYRYGTWGWDWTGEDKDRLLQALTPIKAGGGVSGLSVIPADLIEGKDSKAVRLAAARAGVDAVLVVRGTAATDRYNNGLGATYALLVTPFFVPGTVVDGLFMVSASMWDVRNEYLYLSVEAEGGAKQTAPAIFINEEHVVRDARGNALAALGKDLAPRLQRMARR
jgi:hypothetical protein